MGIKKPLENNYRSAPEIINFNNDFFQSFSTKLPPAFEKFYDAVAQHPVSNKPGFVKVISEKRKPDPTEMIDEIEAVINQCLKDEFDLGDICILTDKNALGIQVANELTKRGITVFSQESLLISRNMEVRLLISYLKWRMKPSVDTMKRQFAELYFRMHASIKDPYFSYIVNAKTSSGKTIKVFDDALFLKDYFGGAKNFFKPFENLVQLVQDFIRLMRWKEVSNPYLHQFSDLVFQFQCNRQSDLSKFIDYYEDNKSKFALKMPESRDAVQIMTIHKSKGLEFPIVIIPKIDFSLSIHNEAKFFVEADGKVLYTSLSKNNVLDEIHSKAIEEENLILLDKLNLLYVGLTRPERRLYLFNRFDRTSNLGYLFHQNMASTFSITENEDSIFYEAGSQEKHIVAEKVDGAFYVPNEVVNESSKFQIAFRKPQTEQYSSQQERLFGIYFHSLMGAVDDASQIQNALDMLINQGLVDNSVRRIIEDTAHRFFIEGNAIGLFDGVQKVFNERSILLPSGQLFIPDKVIIRKNDTIVLDFKTGKKEPKHKRQVSNYKKNLEQILNQSVIPMLYYTRSNEFIQG